MTEDRDQELLRKLRKEWLDKGMDPDVEEAVFLYSGKSEEEIAGMITSNPFIHLLMLKYLPDQLLQNALVAVAGHLLRDEILDGDDLAIILGAVSDRHVGSGPGITGDDLDPIKAIISRVKSRLAGPEGDVPNREELEGLVNSVESHIQTRVGDDGR